MSFTNLSIIDGTRGNSNDTNVTSLDPKMVIYEDVVATVLTTLTVISCVSNILIIVVFVKRKCLRTKHDIIAINLAVTNLIINIGISFYSTYTLDPGDIFHMKFVCLNFFICIFGGILISVIVLLCLALERYICIVYPDIHKQIKVRHVVICNISVYIIGVSYIVIPFSLKSNWDRYLLCVAEVFPVEYSIAELVLGISIMLFTIIINVAVFKIAVSQASKINELLKSVQHKHIKKKCKRQKGKAFVTVFLLSGISSICWIPVLVVFGIKSNPNINESARWIFTQLLLIPVSFNSSITAFIIGYRNRHFRDAIKSLLCRKHHECNRIPLH